VNNGIGINEWLRCKWIYKKFINNYKIIIYKYKTNLLYSNKKLVIILSKNFQIKSMKFYYCKLFNYQILNKLL